MKNFITFSFLFLFLLLTFVSVHSLPLCLFQGHYRLNCYLLETVFNQFVLQPLQSANTPVIGGTSPTLRRGSSHRVWLRFILQVQTYWHLLFIHLIHLAQTLFLHRQTVSICFFVHIFILSPFLKARHVTWSECFLGLFLSHIDSVHTQTHPASDCRLSFQEPHSCPHVLYMGSICFPVLSAVL